MKDLILMIWASLFLLSLVISIGVWLWNRWRWEVPRGENAVLEILYIMPWLVFAIGANIVHLCIYGLYGRAVASCLEMLAFGGCWIAIFKFNMESETPNWCWVRNTAAAVGIWGVMILLRSYIY